jgi:hypothetical protein
MTAREELIAERYAICRAEGISEEDIQKIVAKYYPVEEE